MDAASLLPILALNLRPGDIVLDTCAAPGGKVLALSQTMILKSIIANEVSTSRNERLRRVLKSHLLPQSLDKMEVLNYDASSMEDDVVSTFRSYNANKVIVDVPCLSDRHSLFTESSQSIFHNANFQERLSLPDVQFRILRNAILSATLEATIVYSTCTLFPEQNYGVVKRILNDFSEQDDFSLQLVSTEPIEKCFSHMFGFYPQCEYGSLITPNILSNFGPMYFCIFEKLKKS